MSVMLQNFHPLGLAYNAKTSTISVVNHAQSGPSIEIFKLDQNIATAAHGSTIAHPLIHTPNSLFPISDHELLITNNHKYEIRNRKLEATLKTYLSHPGGSVVYLNLLTNEAKIAADGIPFANGITLLNSTYVAVASTTTPSFSVYAINAATHDLALTQKVSIPFWIDNLKVDSAGTLLMAGHPWVPASTKVLKTNQLYDHDGTGKGLALDGRPRAGRWVAEWDGDGEGKIRDLYVGGVEEFGASTSVVRDLGRGLGFVVGLYEGGILMFKT
ncbi:calcium-dependent phosphotriesterase [Venturia nashicola]|uniref:Calcium-dependent phosphotriesterase n=1 Tax=Venturia nashicola TaxID=86259 RepID=A0A4Z1PI17_9PEZI|nr:calcium-dependent phosphotriesterase [Venturia nashicola]